MASITDTSGVNQEAQRQWELLENADIDSRDRDAIANYVNHRKAHGTKSGDYAASTERDDLNKLRLSAERAETPLADMGLNELNNLLNTLTDPKSDGGYGITTGIDAYTRALRPFFNWLDDHDEHDAYDWWEQIKTGNVDFDEPSDRTFPTQEQIDELIETAKRKNNPRNAALVAFYADTAVRRTLGAQLRVGDVDLSGDRPTFTPNPDGVAQKGVEIKPYPLYDCVALLRTWINQFHPDSDNEDAPLWTTQQYDPDNGDDGALSTRRVNAIMNDLADAAGLPDEVENKPHAFRHAAVGRWKERGYSLAQVQRRTAWKDSVAAEMWGKYGDPDDSKIDNRIDEIEGRDPAEEETQESQGPRDRYQCGNCGADEIVSDYCPECGAAVSPDAKQQEMEDAEKEEIAIEYLTEQLADPDLDADHLREQLFKDDGEQ